MTRLCLLFACALCGVAVLAPAANAAPPPAQAQRAGGFVIHWPASAALSAVQPAGHVRLLLVPSKRARALRRLAVVSLLRVTRSGAPLAIVARRRMRAGTFAPRLPALENAHYRLAVTIGGARVHRDFAVALSDPCPAAASVSATLVATPAEARAGQPLSLSLTNAGTTCLQVGYDVSWQADRDGTWVEIPPAGPVILLLTFVAPQQIFRHDFVVPQDSAPGQYRVVEHISGGGPTVDVTAAVTVVA